MSAERKLKLERADRIEQKAIDWSRRPWFAWGAITVVDGELGAGKSSPLFDAIARVTTGRQLARTEIAAKTPPRSKEQIRASKTAKRVNSTT